MNIVTQVKHWRDYRKNITGSVGFVATMGNLHAGHLQLCQRAKKENDVTVVSIFVNPAQFNQIEDYQHYARTLEEDCQQLAAIGVDYVLVPTEAEMYPDQYQVRVSETALSAELEGISRPGHFEGMLTVVMKLFNLVQPTKAYFGMKDYQQLLLVKKMVSSLFMPIEIVACETVRATDGLALSSRNSRLTGEQRQQAPVFSQLLQSKSNIDEIIKKLTAYGFKVDYIVEKWQRRLGAIWIDGVRLIDNVEINIGE